jgi:glyoxylase-like metal-dependent hydrolase (beta-lactamase superfamily II)
MPRVRVTVAFLAAALIGAAAVAQQQTDFSKIEIKTTQVAEGIYMMQGAGGNLGVSTGPDGVLLIDDEFAPLSDKIKAAIAKVSDKPIRFLFNTHFHGDHVGGNENFGKLGITIVAHDNVWSRMSVEQVNKLMNRTTPPYPKEALPVVTFNDRLTFHLNGDTIEVFHVAPAHTDGDAILRFLKANVVHMGDTFFNGRYPVIDVFAGGSIDGMIAADERVLALVNDQTKIIPGHGPLGDKKSLQAFHDMMVKVRDKIQPLVKAGKTIDEIVAAKPTADFDAQWGTGGSPPDRFVTAVAQGMRAK